MMVELGLEVKHLEETQREMEHIVADLHGVPMLEAMRDATLIVQRDARKKAPVDSGRLRASIMPAVKAAQNDVTGVVGSNVKYAPHMESGTGTFAGGARHWPPSGALEVWARRHGFTSAYLVARAIGMRGGLRPRRYLQRAFEDNKERIIRRIGDVVAEVVRGK